MIPRFQVSVLSILWHFPAQSGDVQAALTNVTTVPWASIFTFTCSCLSTVSVSGTSAQGFAFSRKSVRMSEDML